ncbi:MAG: rhodanese-like domain-containing protein [Terrimicrobiaceae bacterium]
MFFKQDCLVRDNFRNQFLIPLLGALAFLLPTSNSLFASVDFEHPNTYIGNADWDGGLVLWVEVAQIPIGEGSFLPLRMRFTSKEKTTQFDSHWWCPLLESRAILPKSHYVEYSTLGGGGGYLVRKNQFVSDNGKIRATVEANSLELTSSGWIYRYRDGKIWEATTPQGTSLLWTYGESGECTGIKTKDGKNVLEVARTKSEWKIFIPSLNGAFTLNQKTDVAGNCLGWEMIFPDGRKKEIGMMNGADGVTQMTMSDGTTYRLSTESGALLSDSDFSYEMRPADIGRDLLNRVDAGGLTEWYSNDGDKGAATYKRQDGSRVVSWYDLRRGPSNMKPFRMDTISEGQRLVSSRFMTYDSKGELEKEWTEEAALPEDRKARGERDGNSEMTKSKRIRFIALDEATALHETSETLFIDARTAEAFTAGAIPGAINISRTNFENDYPAKENRIKSAKTLVVYCTSRNCEDSSIVATKLARLGSQNVLVFEGGWAEWWKHH